MPSIHCQNLPEFDSTDRQAVFSAFSGMPSVMMRQAWLPQPEPGFLPTEIQAGRQKNSLLVWATIPDGDIFTHATSANQRTWELGDVFEIFLKPEGEDFYRELHITPANIRTQLAFAAEAAPGEFLPDGIFESRVWLDSDRWQVLASIPSTVVTGRTKISPGEKWRFSFCRYDAFRNYRKPIISSTSPHPLPKFHRPAEWGLMVFD